MATARVHGIELYYEVIGHGYPLTMIMGLGCSARMWRWMVPFFAAYFKVVIFDNRGAGRSGKPEMEYTTHLFAEDTRALLRALSIEKTHLFGVSVGGMIAQKCALMCPEVIDKLVLGCTLPNFSYAPAEPAVIQGLMESATLPLEESVEKLVPFFLSEKFIAERPDQVMLMKEVMVYDKREQGPDAFMRQLGAAMSHDTQNEISAINVPTLVITGDADVMVPLENAHFLADQIPKSKLVELPEVNHGFFVERCDEACDYISNFLMPS